MAGDLAGDQARPRQLDHRAQHEVAVGLDALFDGHSEHEVARHRELPGVGDQRDDDLHARGVARTVPDRARGAEERPKRTLGTPRTTSPNICTSRR